MFLLREWMALHNGPKPFQKPVVLPQPVFDRSHLHPVSYAQHAGHAAEANMDEMSLAECLGSMTRRSSPDVKGSRNAVLVW